MVTDPISDFLTRIKNGYGARKTEITSPYSRFREEVGKILEQEGYIGPIKVGSDNNHKMLVVSLQYNGNQPAMENVQRVSRPGQRIYATSHKLPRVLTGYGMAIVSTSKGIMTDRKARKARLGGEVICKVW